MDYEQGLERLKQQAQGTNWSADFALYEARLRENLESEKRHGSSEQIRADRSRIIDQLNRLAYKQSGVSFVDLCKDTHTHINQGSQHSPKAAPPSQNSVFISYSHKDLNFLEELKAQLAPYERSGIVTYWDDTKILPGTVWRNEIDRALQSAKIAVLLVSADFLASDFIAKVEVPFLLEAQKRGVKIFCVIVGHCGFNDSELAQFQAVNAPAHPLNSISKAKREKIWVKLVQHIKDGLK